mmetsp:Transcript_108059/g.336970  ORF Transcript_108059/g.336970 Transcript_108059/m.336970 type:complete len:89 (-) Transcript_108059:9-275(-)
MGGLQQIDKLIRKNLLLKVRRPKGTCFEMTLPLALFVVLAVLRRQYESEIKFVGPERFEHRAISPICLTPEGRTFRRRPWAGCSRSTS